MAKTQSLASVLESLAQNTDVDSLWTRDGLPRLEILSDAVGRDVSRKDVDAVAPLFTRSNPVIGVSNEEVDTVEAAPPPAAPKPAPSAALAEGQRQWAAANAAATDAAEALRLAQGAYNAAAQKLSSLAHYSPAAVTQDPQAGMRARLAVIASRAARQGVHSDLVKNAVAAVTAAVRTAGNRTGAKARG